METHEVLKDSIAMTIGSITLVMMLLWGFPTLGRRAYYESNDIIAIATIAILLFLILFGAVLFLDALSNLGKDYYIAGLFAMCFGTVLLLIMLFFRFLFVDVSDSNLEKTETIIMAGIGIVMFFKGGFYLSKHEPMAGSIAEIIGFSLVLVVLSFWSWYFVELWKALLLILSGFCIIFWGFRSFGVRRSTETAKV